MGGFPKDTMAFLEGIGAHNEKAWFEPNRALYEAGYVAPAQAFVADFGPRLRKIAPEIQFEPRINGSISRINRDIRFSKDKRPYKDNIALYFWHGDEKSWDEPGFYLHISPRGVYFGSGIYQFGKEQLAAYRDAVITDKPGKALEAAVAKVEKAGYTVGGKTRKKIPSGFDAAHPRADWLLYEGLHAGAELPAAAALKPDFAEVCAAHFKATWPIGVWLLKEIAG